MTKIKTGAQLMSQTKEEQAKEDMTYLLEDAETDLNRAIDKGKKEVSTLERNRETQVKAFIQAGSLNDLLQYERDIDAKQADVKRLEKIKNDRFPSKKEAK